MDTETLKNRIREVKRQYGPDLVILGHHYQTDDILEMTDIQGDSLELARRIPGLNARRIVFCGVDFMAESASILATPAQKIYIPDVTASCVMADMAPAPLVEAVTHRLDQTGGSVIPLAYVNSSAAVKALCGQMGGSVCTSANAATMLSWALDQGDRVLFLPDKNLALNTAHSIGLPRSQCMVLDVRGRGNRLDTGRTKGKKLLMWPGVCAIHFKFKSEQIRSIRERHPEARIVVHPECSPELVQAADASGSTSFIIDYVENAPLGQTIFIGTEVHLVKRLRKQYSGKKEILPIADIACSNMAKISLEKLAHLLEGLEDQEPVTVPGDIGKPALLSLERMLRVCS
ncbi:MAG: quinolinate synthase NadA [Desulfovibrionales bacterium]